MVNATAGLDDRPHGQRVDPTIATITRVRSRSRSAFRWSSGMVHPPPGCDGRQAPGRRRLRLGRPRPRFRNRTDPVREGRRLDFHRPALRQLNASRKCFCSLLFAGDFLLPLASGQTRMHSVPRTNKSLRGARSDFYAFSESDQNRPRRVTPFAYGLTRGGLASARNTT